MGYKVKPFTMRVRNNSTQEFEDVGLLGSDVDADISELREDITSLKKKTPWVTPEDFGAIGDGTVSDTIALRKCFAHGGNILIPEGKIYGIDNVIPVYSNSVVQFDGTISALAAGDTSLEFYDRVTETPGYTGTHDVIITGKGVINMNGDVLEDGYATPLRIHHCKNVTIEGITIKNYSKYHAIEIGGSDGVIINDVKFLGCFANGDSGTHEAIQIECVSEEGTFGAIPYDGTVTKNVIIKNCYFGPSDEGGSVFQSIGEHSRLNDPSWSKYFDNVQIVGCVFEENSIRAIYFHSNVQNLLISKNVFNNQRNIVSIYLENYIRDCQIESNRFSNCNGSPILLGSDASTVDTNNTIERINICKNYFYNYNLNNIVGIGGIGIRGVNKDVVISDNIYRFDTSVTNYPIIISGRYQSHSDNLSIQNNTFNGTTVFDSTIIHNDSAQTLAEFLDKRVSYFRSVVNSIGTNHINTWRVYHIGGSRTSYYDIGSVVFMNEIGNRLIMVSYPQPGNLKKIIVTEFSNNTTRHYETAVVALSE